MPKGELAIHPGVMRITFHDPVPTEGCTVQDRARIMDAVRRALKPAGRLVIVEYAKESPLAPASSLHKMSFDEIRNEIEPMGFDLERILDFLPMQHGLIFTLR